MVSDSAASHAGSITLLQAFMSAWSCTWHCRAGHAEAKHACSCCTSCSSLTASCSSGRCWLPNASDLPDNAMVGILQTPTQSIWIFLVMRICRTPLRKLQDSKKVCFGEMSRSLTMLPIHVIAVACLLDDGNVMLPALMCFVSHAGRHTVNAPRAAANGAS